VGTLIDTSILIEAERGKLDLAEHLNESDEYFVSVITASELLHGLHRSAGSASSARRRIFVDETLDRFPTLDIDLEIARKHSRIWADLAAVGKMIGMNDLWIAATCLSHQLKLATHNVREFERVDELVVEVW